MEQFRRYTKEELLLNDAFRVKVMNWSPDDARAFENWAAMHPEEAAVIKTAMEVIRAVHVKNQGLTAGERAVALQQIRALTSHPGRTRQLSVRAAAVAAAAAILLLIAGLVYFYPRLPPPQTHSSHGISEKPGWHWNRESQSRLLRLPDGSTVFLKPGSGLRYPERFSKTHRSVELKGDAFFEVSPDRAKPFLVYAAGTVTRVVGTSFDINTSEQEHRATVKVRTGEVRISGSSDSRTSVSLAAGRQALIDLSTKGIVTTAISPGDAMDDFLHISGQGDIRVTRWLESAQSAFGIPISFDAAALKDHVIRADFEGMHLLEQLDAVCKAIGASYEVADGKITIRAGKSGASGRRSYD